MTNIGPKPNLLQSPEGWRQIKVQQPILTNTDSENREMKDPNFKSTTLKMLFRAKERVRGISCCALGALGHVPRRFWMETNSTPS